MTKKQFWWNLTLIQNKSDLPLAMLISHSLSRDWIGACWSTTYSILYLKKNVEMPSLSSQSTGQVQRSLQDSSKGKELFQCTRARMKLVLIFLNLRSNNRLLSSPALLYRAGRPLPVMLRIGVLLYLEHTLWFCSRSPWDVAEVCQTRKIHNIQTLKQLKEDLIHLHSLIMRPYWLKPHRSCV